MTISPKLALAPVLVLIPAYREGERVAATVAAAWALPGVTRVVVIDDGSGDDTAHQAHEAGAEVISLPVNMGKGAALRAGLEACAGDRDDIILLLDADLRETAAAAAALLNPVQLGEADLTIARFPRATGKAGFGLVKGLARWGTWALTRQLLAAPISGQRAARRWVLEDAPFADGYGIEVAMNVAAADARARVVEVPVAMTHNATGRTLQGFRHRGRQFVEIFAALAAAAFGRTGEPLAMRVRLGRARVYFAAVCLAFLAATHWAAGWMAGALLIAVVLGPPVAAVLSGVCRARVRNYRGRVLPALGGVTLAPALLGLLILGWLVPALRADFPPALLLFVLAWLLLGLIDDVAGNADRKGFRGHVLALLRGEITTGGVKLLGGGALALWAAWRITAGAAHVWLALPVAALLIALSANALNLFDLRPGRALKVWWLVLVPLLVVGLLQQAAWPFLPLAAVLLVATLVFAPFDFAGMMMLGDTGANPLGAFLGVALVFALPLPAQLLAVAALVALHVYAERASITRLIDRVPALRWWDGLGRSG